MQIHNVDKLNALMMNIWYGRKQPGVNIRVTTCLENL